MTLLFLSTHRVKKVSHPFGDDKAEHDGNAESDVSRTLYDNHSEADSHAHCAAKLTSGANQHVLGDVGTLKHRQYTWLADVLMF